MTDHIEGMYRADFTAEGEDHFHELIKHLCEAGVTCQAYLQKQDDDSWNADEGKWFKTEFKSWHQARTYPVMIDVTVGIWQLTIPITDVKRVLI